MTIRCFQVDAFAAEPFHGNPAAVCLLETEAPTQWMQAVANEMNLSDTAFVWPEGKKFGLRWFTPKVEVDLCGHATLATAHVLWSEGIVPDGEPIEFASKSGPLFARRHNGDIELEFPADHVTEVIPHPEMLTALGVCPSETKFVGHSKFDILLEVTTEEVLRGIQPDFALLGTVPTRGIIVTSISNAADHDFVSRFFAPAAGILEDPVTGSAHCALATYWSAKLHRLELTALQASTRSGVINTRLEGERVFLGGKAVTVLVGELRSHPDSG